MSLERLETLRRVMQTCAACSLCKLAPLPTIRQTRFATCCPSVDARRFHAYSGCGMAVIALSLLDGRMEASYDLAQVVSACTTCGACDVACPSGGRHEIIIALKEHLAEAGLAPALPRPTGAFTRLLPQWAEGLGVKLLPAVKCDVLLLVGAGVERDPDHAAVARRLAKLLEAARVDFGILSDEPQIGIDAYWTGYAAALGEQATGVVDRLDACGARTIVTLCGEDLGMLRGKYPRFSYAPQAEVLHASEFLLALVRQGKLRLRTPVQRRVTYHDPCYLGRQSEARVAAPTASPGKTPTRDNSGVFDAPRRLLAAIPGLQFVEMHRTREYAYCCGGGGGVPDSQPDVARSAALQRIAEAEDVGADMLVTACQRCRRNLTCWQDGPGLMVVDLVDMVYAAATVS